MKLSELYEAIAEIIPDAEFHVSSISGRLTIMTELYVNSDGEHLYHKDFLS